jgi:sugar phosphate isomerase/epimerase
VLIGFTVEGFQEWRPAAITAAMRRMGINFIEYNIRVINDFEAVLPQLRGMRTAFHLPIVEEDGWDFSCSGHIDKIDRTIALLQRYHHQMGLRHFIAHPPEPCDDSGSDDTNRESLFSAVQRLPLPVYFENIAGMPPDAFREFLHIARNRLGDQYAGMCYDAAHFKISGYDPVEQFYAFRDQIGSAHLSDCIGSEDSHLPFDSGGELPIRPLLQAMRRTGYAGSITLEIRPNPAGDLVSYIKSYLLLLRSFSPGRYLGARIRFMAAARLIKIRK